MFGKTNSLVAQGGGGDVVKAVNNMGIALAGGEKVWLNRHIFENSSPVQPYNSTGEVYPYNLNNKFYYRQSGNLIRADFKDDAWSFVNVGNVGNNDGVKNTQFRHNLVWQNISNTRSVILENMGNFTIVAGVVVSEDRAVIDNKICTYDPITGAVLVTGGGVNPSGDRLVGAFLFGTTLFVGCQNKQYYFYDVTDINAPVLLKQGTFTANGMVVYATGLAVGDYLIAVSDMYWGSECKKDTLAIYKIMEDYRLETATDLPQGLESMVGVGTRITYNNNTGVLCVGTDKKPLFYQFFDGGFHVLDITLPELPETRSGDPYLARLNDDMSTLAILAITGGSSYTYYGMWFYRLSVFNDKWYAEPYADSSAASFTGFAEDAAEAGAEVSVKTVFPKVLTLTLEVENDGAAIDVKGAK